MTSPCFVSFDGPKATGKTTILEAVAAALRADGRYPIVHLCEKDLDPYRTNTLGLIKELTAQPTEKLEHLVCDQLAAGRAWITDNVLQQVEASSIVLIDRWYPSDAAFRRILPFDQILAMNLDRHVRVPDLHVGVVTTPDISWARASARSRGLNSVVIQNFGEHIACTDAFNHAVAINRWFSCRNESSIGDATLLVTSAIYACGLDLSLI
ncbi:thymidylate kinase [Pseudomonas moorei]|nr:thymidylate kinase [Pseudomonas moorei]